ncbi:hypothetical protein H632_c5446p0, partial [Helicosporidium sp. ATCC 50920]
VHEADNLPPEEFAPKYTQVELGRAVDIDNELDMCANVLRPRFPKQT